MSPDAIACSTTTTPSTPKQKKARNRIKPEGEPKWVTEETRPHYQRLVNDSVLLAKVTEAIETSPNNLALTQEIVPLGFSKRDGTALGDDKMPRIKKVVKHLNTP